MQYDKKGNPVTKSKRLRRRVQEGDAINRREEHHRKRVATGGQDSTGATGGQNAEPGNARIPEFSQDIGRRA